MRENILAGFIVALLVLFLVFVILIPYGYAHYVLINEFAIPALKDAYSNKHNIPTLLIPVYWVFNVFSAFIFNLWLLSITFIFIYKFKS